MKSLDNIIDEFAKLPGIGRKSAMRIAFHVLEMEDEELLNFMTVLKEAKEKIKKCEICGNLTENDICEICSDEERAPHPNPPLLRKGGSKSLRRCARPRWRPHRADAGSRNAPPARSMRTRGHRPRARPRRGARRPRRTSGWRHWLRRRPVRPRA